jgi:hypothetical protein
MSKRAAPQSRSKARSGGGIRVNKLRQVGVRTGPPRTDVVSVGAVSELGARTAIPRQDLIKGTAPQVRSGNDVAESTVCGPGGSRTVYKTGYQALSGPVSKGEGGIRGAADRGSRAILGPQPNDTSPFHPVPFRKGQQVGE